MNSQSNSTSEAVNVSHPASSSAIPTSEPPKATKTKVKVKPKASKAEPGSKATRTNPYRQGGSYWAVVETLRKLGVGKMHPADAVLKTYPGVVGDAAWKAFKAKDKRNDETGKDASARVVQNCIVVNRPDYGASLRAVGWEVRKGRNDQGYLFGLFKAISKAVPAAASRTRTNDASKPKGKTAPKAKTVPGANRRAKASDKKRSAKPKSS